MNTSMFLILLSAFSVLTGLVTEAVKHLINNKAELSYNIVALISALIIGIGGTAVYYCLNGISFTNNNIICMVLMGFASSLVSMVGFDKVKQAILQITSNK